MTSYKFEPMTERRIKEVISSLGEKFPHVNEKILRHHNDICPNCQTSFRRYDNIIQSVGAVSAFIPHSDPLSAIVYCVCNKCTKSIERSSRNPSINPTDKIETFIEGIFKSEIAAKHPLKLKIIDTTNMRPHYFNSVSQKRIEERLEEFENKYKEFRVDTTLLNFFNNICPSCKISLENSDGVLHGGDAVNAHIDAPNKLVVPYVICSECADFTREFVSKRQNATPTRYGEILNNTKLYVQEIMYDEEISDYTGRY